MGSMDDQGGQAAEAINVTVGFALLSREFPAWAVWRPCPGRRQWVAVRSAAPGLPGPDLPLVWADAADAAQLADLMRRVDEQMSC
jgi:hypothetical protein